MRLSRLPILALLAAPAFGQQFLHHTSGSSAAEDYAGANLHVEGDLLYVSKAQYNFGPGRIDVYSTSTGEYLSSLHDPTPTHNMRFGSALCVDGDILTCTAPASRELFIFDLAAGTPPVVADLNPWPNAGAWTLIHDDLVYVSTSSATTPAASWVGALLVFDLAGNHVNTIYNPNGATGDAFTYAMALDGDLITLSEKGADRAQVYDINAGTLTELTPPAFLVSDDHFGIAVNAGGGMSFIAANGYNGFHGALFVYDSSTGALLYQIDRPAGAFENGYGSAAQYANGKIYIHNGWKLFVHDAADGTLLSEMDTPGGASRFVVDEHVIVSADPFTSHDGITNSGRIDIFGHESIGTPFCTAVPNSTGVTGKCHVMGSIVAADNATTLAVTEIPAGESALLVNGPATTFIANPGGSDGNLCIAGGIGRFSGNFQTASPAGSVFFELDTTAMPRPTGQPAIVAIQAGETWHFQGWHRDGASSNFTEATSVTFQ